MNRKLPPIEKQKNQIQKKSKLKSNQENQNTNHNYQLPTINFNLDYEQQINVGVQNIIFEYLLKNNFMKTLENFKDESSYQQIEETQNYQEILLREFEQKNRKVFFEAWEKFIPLSMRIHVKETVILEFLLQLYFIFSNVKPIAETSKPKSYRIDRKTSGKSCKSNDRLPSRIFEGNEQYEKAIIELKDFLSRNGEELSKIEELLPYYALPYLKEPHAHPQFKGIFSEDWQKGIQKNLEKFLGVLYSSSSKPFILKMYEETIKEKNRETKPNEGRIDSSPLESNSNLQKNNKQTQFKNNSKKSIISSLDRCESANEESISNAYYESSNKKNKDYVNKLEADNKKFLDIIELLNDKVNEKENQLLTFAAQTEKEKEKIVQTFKKAPEEILKLTKKLYDFALMFKDGREQFLDKVKDKISRMGFKLEEGKNFESDEMLVSELDELEENLPKKIVNYLKSKIKRQLPIA